MTDTDDETPTLVIDMRPPPARRVGGGLDGPEFTHQQGRRRPKLRPSRDVGR